MSKLKKWFHGVWVSITMALGVQYARPPVIEDRIPPAVEAAATPKPSPKPVIVGPVNEIKKPDMNLESVTGATESEKKIVVKSINYGKKVLPSECFKDGLMKAELTETNGLSNAGVYDLISQSPAKVKVEIYNGSWKENYIWKTMGYDIGDGVTYINRFYFGDAVTAMSLEIHEAIGHGKGFHHYGYKGTSVPYQLNNISEKCAEELQLGKEET